MACNYEDWGILQCVRGAENTRSLRENEHLSTEAGSAGDAPGERAMEMVSQGRKRKILEERRQARLEHAKLSKAIKKQAIHAAGSSVWQHVLPEVTRERIALPFNMHASHACVECGGFVACVRCGATATCSMKGNRLEKECSAVAPRGGSAHRVQCLIKGKLPRKGLDTWPDGSIEPQPRRIRAQV